ncbi:hypothetical protein [Calothrix sp. PCC 7507]|uniref:hypothetical protein n=1 Tax=Calothrix sp. PCC 7507 TaxID=99598 RepID=UPI00029ECDE3|nr:hypothetical protein [Calothrix sp. PCC 7507]AFY32732.1 hypothetical protein Cal7507_2297 [Calothrix sp. PCC 7507]
MVKYSSQASDRQDDLTTLSELAGQILRDPLLRWQISQRVYQLMQEDMRSQRETAKNYTRLF